MDALIPPFEFRQVFIDPWARDIGLYGWIALMGFLVALSCGLVGHFLVLRRMALVGDAISHSVLPGIAAAFLLAGSREPWVMFPGALVAGMIATALIEFIQGRSRIKQDAAIGVTFTTLFAIGVILISLFAGKIDLDQECVLYGEINLVPLEPMVMMGGVPLAPAPVMRMGAVALLVILLVTVFYKELLVSSFDPGLAASQGFRPRLVHYLLMGLLSAVIVSAFEAVGAILVIAMLILPGATGLVLGGRLPAVMMVGVAHAALSATLGMHLAVWLDCSTAGAMVVTGGALFALAWVLSPTQGALARLLRGRSASQGA